MYIISYMSLNYRAKGTLRVVFRNKREIKPFNVSDNRSLELPAYLLT